MKRLIVLTLIVLLLSGCVNVKKASLEEIIEEATESKTDIYNTYRQGYKFYLPSGLYIYSSKDYNEVIKSDKYTYYLYIDLVSYLNDKTNTYVPNNDSYYSMAIQNGDKSGYIEINEKNDKYLVEIMYNYAKIEVIVDENDINSAVADAIIVLSSIYYNDGILDNLSNDNILNYNEENIDIFSSDSGSENSNFLESVDDYEGEYEEDYVPDYDLIN